MAKASKSDQKSACAFHDMGHFGYSYNFLLQKGPTDNSKEPDPGGSDQQIVQIKTEYRKTDRTVGIDKLNLLPIFRQVWPDFFRE